MIDDGLNERNFLLKAGAKDVLPLLVLKIISQNISLSYRRGCGRLVGHAVSRVAYTPRISFKHSLDTV